MDAKQIKDSILQYAMQGKLLPQDPKDEPTIELLKRIKEKKEKLIAQKIIKKEKVLSDISEEEIPFDIPDTWEWVRLGDIAIYIQRGKSPKYSDIEKVPVISQKCIQWKGFNLAAARFVAPDTMDKYDSVRFVRDGDLLWNSTGLGTVGRINRYSSDGIGYETVVVDSHVTIVRLMDSIDSEFILRYLASPIIQQSIEDICSGSTKQKELNTGTIKNILVPVPPINEQKRLVEKIKELSLGWKRYENLHESIITLDDELPSNLEKSILQYAMQGKLVEQGSTDEPASKLIERIKLKKEELIKNKVIKKEKALPEITEDEIPFEIPESWEWVRLKDISTFGNFESMQPSKVQEDDWVLDLEDIEKDTGVLLNRTTNKKKKVKSNKYKFNKGDVLYGKLRPYLNKVIIAPEDGVCTTEIFPLKFLEGISPEYMQFALMSPYFVNYANRCSYGVKMPRMGTTQTAMAVIPLPPLNEQLKVVDELKRLLKIKNRF
ncbi:hypothetical protein CN428_24465 [Bacillus cereus]|nr:hypothetical protein CN428_24465 [Bacillus cereus]